MAEELDPRFPLLKKIQTAVDQLNQDVADARKIGLNVDIYPHELSGRMTGKTIDCDFRFVNIKGPEHNVFE